MTLPEVSIPNENCYNIYEFVASTDFPEDFKESFKKAAVSKVEISTREKVWRIFLEAPELLSKQLLQSLSERLGAEIPGLKELFFEVRYKIPTSELASVLTNYWDDLVFSISRQHPILYSWLNSATRQVDGNRLTVTVKNELGLEILTQKKADILLNALLSKEFGVTMETQLRISEIPCCDETEEWRERQEEEYVRALVNSFSSTGSAAPKKEALKTGGMLLGKSIKDEPGLIKDIVEEEKSVVIQGRVFNVDVRELKSGRTMITFDLTDLTDSITVKVFDDNKGDGGPAQSIKNGLWLTVKGPVQPDKYSQELTIIARDLQVAEHAVRTDDATEKRVELHLHTKMSSMDGINGVGETVARAAAWGHPALAITDHGVVQAFPDAYDAGKKHGIKIIYGVEGYLVDDGAPIVINPHEGSVAEETFVVFDLETTGFSPQKDEIIEIGAVKIAGGEIVGRFSRFVRPNQEIPLEVRKLTGINMETVAHAPGIGEVLPEFMEFVGGATIVAHNAQFDAGFLRVNLRRILRAALTNSVLDTLGLARALYPKIKNHKLKTLAEEFKVGLANHHRAVDDAEATAQIFQKMLPELDRYGIKSLNEINGLVKHINLDKIRSKHIVILVKDMTGLKNLYRLVTAAHLSYFFRHPRIPKTELVKHREGLILGSACESGELFKAILDGAGEEKLEEIAGFYDYLEIQPRGNNEFLLRTGQLASEEELLNINRNIVKLGEKLGKPVVATGDVHFLDPADECFRRILMAGKGFEDADNQAPLYLKTTGEMLAEFAYLGDDKAREVVIVNPRQIADMVEDEIKPMPDDFYPPKIEGAEDQIVNMTNEKARSIYGDELPEIVQKTVDKELNSIISNGFAVLYLIAHKLVKKSNDDGYLVGSRGSVGSSFVATMTGITEVNPLPPHYVCPQCKQSEFITDGSFGSGADLPDKDCPGCGTRYRKDGHDIPFEVFLGFKGDKVPDIDLNFSGDYQPRAHKYTEELFGEGYVFRAGTTGTIAEKTAFGFVKKYLEEKNTLKRMAEMNRLVAGCTGVKRTTGQHPGGVMVIPRDMDVHDFTPLQHPADDKKSGIITTHFDYHSISGRIVKLDILGHDDPTVIKMLEDLTGIDAKTIPLDEPVTMKIFSGTEVLGVTPEQIRSKMGTYGIPEFGTKFVRQMLEDTIPKTFSELVRISGFSHGTDVWLNNAQDLIRAGACKLSEAISARDDIMIYLIHKGLEPSRAFKIMEGVRKGKGVKPEDEEEMRKNNVPDWYIESCKKIKYMFPKAHAVAYVMMAYRIAYFKVHHPAAFYTTYFTVRADEFDADLICQGTQAVLNKIEEIEAKGNQAQTKEKNLLTILEVALEMYVRGIKLRPVDLALSHATRFQITEQGILPPFAALQGVGDAAAKSITRTRKQKLFTSVEDLRIRAKLSKPVIELLQQHGCLHGLPETDQMVLF